MSDKQDFYTGQLVDQAEMDVIYSDLDDAEVNLANDAGARQGAVADADKYGGILSGGVVTFNAVKVVNVSACVARDDNGVRIPLTVAATVSLTKLGATPEGDTTNATGAGANVSTNPGSGLENWVSLYLVHDTHYSDARTDALGNPIQYRQEESFHFFIDEGGLAAAPSSTRQGPVTGKVLLTQILLDDDGEIQLIGGVRAICGSTKDFNTIGYGPLDAAALAGQRSDWVAIDSDGTDLTLWQNAYDTDEDHNAACVSVRAGTPQEALRELAEAYATLGTPTQFAGTELIGGKSTTGKVLTNSAAAAYNLASETLHTQLSHVADQLNNRVPRGGDTGLTGDYILKGQAAVHADAGESALLLRPDAAALSHDQTTILELQAAARVSLSQRIFSLLAYGEIGLPRMYREDFPYRSSVPSSTLGDHLPTHVWHKVQTPTQPATTWEIYNGQNSYIQIALGANEINGFAHGIKGPNLWNFVGGKDAATFGAWFVTRFRLNTAVPPAGHEYKIGLFGTGANADVYLKVTSADIYVVKGDATPQSVALIGGAPTPAIWYTAFVQVVGADDVWASLLDENTSTYYTGQAGDADSMATNRDHELIAQIYNNSGGVSSACVLDVDNLFVCDFDVISGLEH